MKMKMAALFGIGLLLITGTACVTTPVASPECKPTPIEQPVPAPPPMRPGPIWPQGKNAWGEDPSTFKTAKEGENPWYPYTHQWIGRVKIDHPKQLVKEVIKQFGPPPQPKTYAQTGVGLCLWKIEVKKYFKEVYKGFDINGWYKQNAI